MEMGWGPRALILAEWPAPGWQLGRGGQLSLGHSDSAAQVLPAPVDRGPPLPTKHTCSSSLTQALPNWLEGVRLSPAVGQSLVPG